MTDEGSRPPDMTVRDLLEALRPSELWATIVALATVVSVAFLAGWNLAPSESSSLSDAVNIVDAAGRGGAVQSQIRSRDSVTAFERFLEKASEEQWSDAFALMSDSWRDALQATEPADLANSYRMTNRHEFHYYIPTRIEPSREEYDVEFSYWDFFPNLPFREALTSRRLKSCLRREDFDDLVGDFVAALPECYSVPREQIGSLDQPIREILGTRTFRDLVLRDDLIELIGQELGFAPIIDNETYQGKWPAEERRRMFNVVLVKHDRSWFVNSYNSYLMDKR